MSLIDKPQKETVRFPDNRRDSSVGEMTEITLGLTNQRRVAVPQRLNPRWKELGWALLYISPALLIFLVFTYFPFIRSVWLSFYVTTPTGEPARFNDVKYYSRILNLDGSGRDEYLKSILTTVQFSLMVVPLGIITALALAVLATAKVRIIGVFRTIFTSSVAISVASASVIWSLIYTPTIKVTQWLVDLLHLKSESLLNDASTALLAVAFMTVWSALGFNFIITLSGIQAIPQDLYESGRIDGANGWTGFRYITLPLLTPTLMFLFIISTIQCFQAFTQFNVMIGNEGPDNSTNVMVYSLFTAFWKDNRYGFASAISVVLFAILIILTVIQYRVLDKRVHYQ
ncbi:MAG: sugar ABC transporter permease [Chloroflexi bacterium]|nr:sugar ABC transporter permease [Chloroflexota bacterium]